MPAGKGKGKGKMLSQYQSRVDASRGSLQTPSLFDVQNASNANPELFAAAQRIKMLQRSDPTGKAEWWAYCDLHGDGVRDPLRHNLSFLQPFLANYSAGHRLKGGGRGKAKHQAAASVARQRAAFAAANHDGLDWAAEQASAISGVRTAPLLPGLVTKSHSIIPEISLEQEIRNSSTWTGNVPMMNDTEADEANFDLAERNTLHLGGRQSSSKFVAHMAQAQASIEQAAYHLGSAHGCAGDLQDMLGVEAPKSPPRMSRTNASLVEIQRKLSELVRQSALPSAGGNAEQEGFARPRPEPRVSRDRDPSSLQQSSRVAWSSEVPGTERMSSYLNKYDFEVCKQDVIDGEHHHSLAPNSLELPPWSRSTTEGSNGNAVGGPGCTLASSPINTWSGDLPPVDEEEELFHQAQRTPMPRFCSVGAAPPQPYVAIKRPQSHTCPELPSMMQNAMFKNRFASQEESSGRWNPTFFAEADAPQPISTSLLEANAIARVLGPASLDAEPMNRAKMPQERTKGPAQTWPDMMQSIDDSEISVVVMSL